MADETKLLLYGFILQAEFVSADGVVGSSHLAGWKQPSSVAAGLQGFWVKLRFSYQLLDHLTI